MKAIIVAAGIGSRLGELTKNTTKSLVNVNDKTVTIHTTKNSKSFKFNVKIRIDTAMEWNYFTNDGILNYVLKNIANQA